MMLSLDVITLGVPEVRAAEAFYTSVFSPIARDHGQYVNLDMRGTGQVALYGIEALAADADAEPATSGFRGHVLSAIVTQPNEVEALLDAAVQGGATVLKPAKKSLFGGFSAVYQAPDGAIWKLSAETKKDTGPAGEPPLPIETAAFLGVASPETSKAFYTALGMTADRDYGDKWVDLLPAPGTCRLGLVPRQALAKDAGVDADGAGFHAAVFSRRAESREEVEAILSAAVTAGGKIAVAAEETEWGGYSGHFTDPDGFVWNVASRNDDAVDREGGSAEPMETR